jgi:rhamnose transport system permease protein
VSQSLDAAGVNELKGDGAKQPLILKLVRFREFAILFALIVVFVVTSLKNTSFAGTASIQGLLAGPAVIILIAIGETLVIITRNVDLTVGSVLGLSAYLVGDLYVHYPHTPVILALLFGIVVGAACGVITGAIVAYARVPSLAVTLGLLYIIRGVDAVVVNAVQINSNSLPEGFINVGANNFIGIPILMWIAIIVVAVVGYVMRNYRAAREMYAIGSNPEAALLAGIPIQRRIFSAFVVSGALAGLAGALWLAEFATVGSTAGTGYELDAVAAAVVGGVAIFGGSGTVLGAALGALFLNTINQALVAGGVSSFWDLAVAGLLLVLAIAFDRYLIVRSERVLRVEGRKRGRH